MVTIKQLKDNATDYVLEARKVATQVQTIVVVEDSVLTEGMLNRLADANGRSFAAKTILHAIKMEKATKLDEPTVRALLRRGRADLRGLIEYKRNAAAMEVMYDYITVLEQVQEENEYEN